jgi:hypothetical protein
VNKKLILLLFCFTMIVGLVIPVSSVSAAPGGLLDKKAGYSQSEESYGRNPVEYRATDNNLNSAADFFYSGKYIEWTLTTPSTISSYILRLTTGNAKLVLYNSNREELLSRALTKSGSVITVNLTTPIENVTYVRLQSTDTNTDRSYAYEFDVFGTPTVQNPPIADLAAISGNARVVLSWTSVTGATYQNVKRSTTAGGPYTLLGTSTTNSYIDATATNGTSYYYVVTYEENGVESDNSNEVTGTPEGDALLDVVIDKDKIRVGEEFTAAVSLNNVSNIYAEDFKIKYDSDLLSFVGFEEVLGYKIYNQPSDENGMLRFIIASQGEQYGITGEQVFLNLKFKGKARGTAKVDALECRIADTEAEYDLDAESCLEDTINIEGPLDVNRSGEYTLVDLAIDAFYYGMLAANTDHSKHDADQIVDDSINDEDLLFIVSEMLKNTNYSLNS